MLRARDTTQRDKRLVHFTNFTHRHHIDENIAMDSEDEQKLLDAMEWSFGYEERLQQMEDDGERTCRDRLPDATSAPRRDISYGQDLSSTSRWGPPDWRGCFTLTADPSRRSGSPRYGLPKEDAAMLDASPVIRRMPGTVSPQKRTLSPTKPSRLSKRHFSEKVDDQPAPAAPPRYDPVSSTDEVELSMLSLRTADGSQLETDHFDESLSASLKGWWDMYASKPGDFRRWAGGHQRWTKCCANKVITKAASDWPMGPNESYFACKHCVKLRRPCLRLDDTGEIRVIDVLAEDGKESKSASDYILPKT
ncbi:hypothetical protein LTR53_013425 [Teratosphaeriaceae sp. CCFEE 6253]|nr:hypothetical protein LTR53_013425 [Teratosphaeriaceae sp. CCFEE 6253]